MSSRNIQTEEIQSQTGVIRATGMSRYAIDPDIEYDDLQGDECITKDMLEQQTGGASAYVGAWSNTESYGNGDVVDYKGTLWRSQHGDNTANPQSPADWTDILNTQIRFKIPAGTAIPFYRSVIGTLLERGFHFKAEIITGSGATTTAGAEGVIYNTVWDNPDWVENTLNPIDGLNIYAPSNEAGTGNMDNILITLSRA